MKKYFTYKKVNKKSYEKVCKDIEGECDSLVGLMCLDDSSGSKICK